MGDGLNEDVRAARRVFRNANTIRDVRSLRVSVVSSNGVKLVGICGGSHFLLVDEFAPLAEFLCGAPRSPASYSHWGMH